MRRHTAVLTAFSILMSAGSAQGLTVLYVDDDASGANDGSSWCNAYTFLQDGLGAAIASGGTVTEIRVAQGRYTPDQGIGQVPADRLATFQLVNGVALAGGYAGCGAVNPDERNFDTYKTILSGDLDGNDLPVVSDCCYAHSEPGCDAAACETAVCSLYPECCASPWSDTCAVYPANLCTGFCGTHGENSYHIVTGGDTAATAVLDGFSIAAGNADATGTYESGGGMTNNNSSPMLTNCSFRGNTASKFGGGMYNYLSSPTLVNCTFTRNTGGLTGGLYNGGGGIYNSSSSPTVTNCTFSGNTGSKFGGGLHNYNSSPTVANCTFNGNTAVLYGGGMFNSTHWGNSSPTVTNCAFRGNTASAYGGGMFNGVGASPTLSNCTFMGNTARYFGGGIYNGFSASPSVTNCTFTENTADVGGGMFNDVALVRLDNCILWGDSPEEIFNDGSSVTISFTDVQGGLPVGTIDGGGNIDADPLFVPGPGGRFYLSQVPAGQAVDSPCVDAGSDTAVNMGLDTLTTRSDEAVDTGVVDIGYHYAVTGRLLIMGDFDRSGKADLVDVAALENCFTGEGPTDVSPCCRIYDFEPDGDVALDDFALFQEAFTGSH